MKRFFASLSIVLFLSSSGVVQASFSDVFSTDFHYAAITALVDQEVLTGYGDSTFRPDQEVTRAEAVKIILLGLGIGVQDSTAAIEFTDVTEIDWFFDVVGTSVNLAFVKGYDDQTFKPNQTVNRAEALKMLALAANGTITTPSNAPFVDVAVSEWFAPYAAYAKTWNIEPLQWDGLWHPEALITRANMAEMVYRLQTVRNSGTSFDESTNWPRKDFPTVDVSLKIPFGWSVKQDGVGAIWLADQANGQFSLLSPYENAGTLLMTRYQNAEGRSASELFANIRSQTHHLTSETSMNGNETLVIQNQDGLNYKEWYVVLENGSLVHFVGMSGDGPYAATIENYLEKIMMSVEYKGGATSDLTKEEILEVLRSAIQVDDAGENTMAVLSDWQLLETDSIGVGTGPVDYYYSPTVDATIKYERSFDVILDLREGQTTSF